MPTKLHDDFKQHKPRGSSILVKIVLSEEKKPFFAGCTEKVMNKSGEQMHSKVIQNTFPTCPQDCNEVREDGGRWAVAEQCL